MMLALAMAMLMQGAPEAAPRTVGPRSPEWQRSPGPDDYPRYFPAAERQAFQNGRATLSCRIVADGGLEDCRAEDVSPAGSGFGEAVLKMRSLFRMPPTAAGGRVRVPIAFNLIPDLQAAPVSVKHPEVSGVTIGVDCRYGDPGLDDCSSSWEGPGKEIAIAMASAMPMPKPPRPHGRILIPLAFAGPPPGETDKSQIVPPDWLRRPTGEDIARVYPNTTANGLAVTSCSVTAQGTLADCKTLEESPGGAGFGAAALKLMPLFKIRPMTRDGVPVDGGTVRIPIRFIITRG